MPNIFSSKKDNTLSTGRTSWCNKVDAVRLFASYRLNLLLLKGQRCVYRFHWSRKFLKAAAASKVLHICSTVISQIKFTSLELNPNLVTRFLNLNEQQYYLLSNPSQVGRYNRVSHETWQLINSFECRLKLIFPNSYIIFLLLFLVLNNLTNYERRHSKLYYQMFRGTPCIWQGTQDSCINRYEYYRTELAIV